MWGVLCGECLVVGCVGSGVVWGVCVVWRVSLVLCGKWAEGCVGSGVWCVQCMWCVGCGVLDVGCWMWGVVCGVLDVVCCVWGVGCGVLYVGCWMWVCDCRASLLHV